MSHYDAYNYIIVNEQVEESVRQVQAIITAERLKFERLTGVNEFVSNLRASAS